MWSIVSMWKCTQASAFVFCLFRPYAGIVSVETKWGEWRRRGKYLRTRKRYVYAIAADQKWVHRFNVILDFQVNIPEFSHKSPMWRYFSKINIDALVEITKWKKEKDDGTTFSDIRKRWGNHRKSIKNRMKKFYSKESTAKTETNGNHCCSDDDLGSQAASCSTSTSLRSSEDSPVKGESTATSFDATDGGDSRKHRPKGERNLFGSLGRLRKSRTSLFLDDVAPRKKILITYGSDFQNELKTEVVRRSNDEAKVSEWVGAVWKRFWAYDDTLFIGERHVPW